MLHLALKINSHEIGFQESEGWGMHTSRFDTKNVEIFLVKT
mgnify:CR=1 FL=1